MKFNFVAVRGSPSPNNALLVAIFQSLMYGAFTPLGGVFATLTRVGMLGRLIPAATITGALMATGVTALV